MAKVGDNESSAFVSRGKDTFPPLYFDNEDVRNFSDDVKWPTPVLIGRMATYLDFIAKPDTMPRARKTGQRVIDHIIFELSYKEGIYMFDQPIPDDTPTEQFEAISE